MDCHKAKELIDLRLHEEASEPAATRQDWAALDAHLASCPKCAADWNELKQARALLAEMTSDAPRPEEVETMWNAIAPGATAPTAATGVQTRRAAFWQIAAASVGIAAVLGVAFQLGKLHYGAEFGGALTFRNVDAPSVACTPDVSFSDSSGASSQEGTRHPRRTPSRRKKNLPAGRSISPSSGWRIPVHPEQTSLTARGGVVATLNELGYVAGETREGLGEVFSESREAGGLSDVADTDESKSVVGMAAEVEYPGAPDALDDKETPGTDADMIEVVRPPRRRNGPSEDTDSRYERTEDSAATAEPPASPPQRAPRTKPKIIKTGQLAVEVEGYADAVGQVENIAGAHGGFVADVSTRELAGGALSGTLKIRVVPESFEPLFSALKAIGRLEAEDVKATDVTAAYVDLESRIASLEITEQRLNELISNKSFIDKISSLLEVERELKRVRTEREQLVGQLRVMRDRIGMSTITMTLHEPPRTVPSATLTVETTVLDDAARVLADILTRLDGRLVSGTTAKRSDGTLTGSYALKINLSRFREFVMAVEELGRVQRREISDQQFRDSSAPWANEVPCRVILTMHERPAALPGGTMHLEVDQLEDALKQLTADLARCDGSIASNRTTRQSDGSSVAQLSVRVPAGRFAELLDAVAVLGRTTAKSVSGSARRVEGGAADTPCELSLTVAERPREVPSGHIMLEVEQFEAARTQLSTLVGEKDIQVTDSSSNQRTDGSWIGSFSLGIKAGDMEAALARLESLGRVATRQINGLGLGDLSRVDPDTVGVISLTLAEPAAIAPGPERAGQSIRARLRDGLVGMYTSLGLIAYGLVVLAPWLVIVLLPAWLLTRVVRKRKAVKKAAGAS